MGSEYQDIKLKRRIYTTEIIKESRENANWIYSFEHMPDFKGTDPKFLSKIAKKKIYICWKSILRYGRDVSQNISGLRVLEPP